MAEARRLMAAHSCEVLPSLAKVDHKGLMPAEQPTSILTGFCRDFLDRFAA